jgi:hypothetical protein
MSGTAFGLRPKQFKSNFFDRPHVWGRINAGNLRPKARSGGLIRKIAKRSIRKRKKASTPEQAPSSHAGVLRDLIFFAHDATTGGVVIGPAAINFERDDGYTVNTKRPTETLEEGGKVGIHEVFYRGRWVRRGFAKKQRGQRKRVRWVRIAARPYMGPALKTALPKISEFWANSIKG